MVFLLVPSGRQGSHAHHSDINLPTCGIAFVLLLLTLKLNPTRKLTLDKFLRTFDFIGMCVTEILAAWRSLTV